MSDDDLKSVLAKYQQKAFELFNHNIVLEAQVEKLNANLISLSEELEKLKKSRKTVRSEEQFQ
jgi:uncharacterized phage infection (PIP) family protein YhgE